MQNVTLILYNFYSHAGPDAEAAKLFLWNSCFWEANLTMSGLFLAHKEDPLDFCQVGPNAPPFITGFAVNYSSSGG